MRKLLVSVLLVAVAAGALGFAAAAYAGGPTPTPSPTATPTPSPTATPVPTSTITIRFVRHGEPVIIAIAFPVDDVFADGIRCNIPGPLAVYIAEVSEYSTSWPLLLEQTGAAQECTQGPPTVLRFEIGSVDFGTLVAEFVWTGEDIVVDIEVPPSATPTPTTTVEELPPTGGSGPGRGGDSAPWITLWTISAALIAAGTAVAWRLAGHP